MTMTHVLVTGGAGYIGSVLVPRLLQKGFAVTVLDNFLYRQITLLDCCHNSNFQIIRGDARDEKLITHCLKKADVIFPLACYTGAPACDQDPKGAKTTNLGAIKLLLKHRSHQQRIIFPNTNSGYGIGQEGIACDENSPLRPISLYGRLKVEAEKHILDAGHCVVFRLATVFGISPRMRLDLLVNDFTHRAIFKGVIKLFEAHFVRNFISIHDVASAFLFALEHFEKMKGAAYNVGLSDCNLSKLQLCEEIKKEVPHLQIKLSKTGKDVDQRNYIVSNAKIEAAGFRPRVSLREGIRELIKGFQVIQKGHFANV